MKGRYDLIFINNSHPSSVFPCLHNVRTVFSFFLRFLDLPAVENWILFQSRIVFDTSHGRNFYKNLSILSFLISVVSGNVSSHLSFHTKREEAGAGSELESHDGDVDLCSCSSTILAGLIHVSVASAGEFCERG